MSKKGRGSWASRFADKYLHKYIGGHITIGRLTIYGRNAMHYAWNYQRRDGMYVCFRPPSRCFGLRLGYYFYISPDGTPSDAIYYRPKKYWGIEEPNDPAYHKAMWMKKVIEHDIQNFDQWARASNFDIKPKRHYLKRLEQDYEKAIK